MKRLAWIVILFAVTSGCLQEVQAPPQEAPPVEGPCSAPGADEAVVRVYFWALAPNGGRESAMADVPVNMSGPERMLQQATDSQGCARFHLESKGTYRFSVPESDDPTACLYYAKNPQSMYYGGSKGIALSFEMQDACG